MFAFVVKIKIEGEKSDWLLPIFVQIALDGHLHSYTPG
jgi:hypothetical protein